jgi:hypothetical protein
MQNRLNELIKLVGTPYEMFWDDGNYLGCFMPMYYLWPDLPRYPLPSENLIDDVNFKYGLRKILLDFDRIDADQVQPGDMLACKFNKELHVGIMLDKDKLIHVSRDCSLKISRLHYLANLFENPVFFRKKNV